MKKTMFKFLMAVELIALVVLVMLLNNAFAGVETIKDDNDGNKGYILINTGIQQGGNDVGHWTDITTIPELKGEKGDTGEQGIQGVAGIDGLNGQDGIDGQNGLDGQQGIQGDKGDIGNAGLDGADGQKGDVGNKGDTGLQGIQGFSGLNGLNGKDVDPKEVKRLDDRIDGVSNRVSKLEKTQYVIRTELKFIREKHLEVGVYGEYNVGRSLCSEVGLNIVIPIGEGYQDRENKKVNARLDRIEQYLTLPEVTEGIQQARMNKMKVNTDGKSFWMEKQF